LVYLAIVGLLSGIGWILAAAFGSPVISLIIVAAMVFPGGFLLLDWALHRRRFRVTHARGHRVAAAGGVTGSVSSSAELSPVALATRS
jgi:hypothetical protein